MSLSDRIRPDVEATPWVIEEVKKLEAENAMLKAFQTLTDRGFDCTGHPIPCVIQAPCARHLRESAVRAMSNGAARDQRQACADALVDAWRNNHRAFGLLHEAVLRTKLVTGADE